MELESMMAKDSSSDALFHSNTDYLAVLFKYLITVFQQQNCKRHDIMSYTSFSFITSESTLFFSFIRFSRLVKIFSPPLGDTTRFYFLSSP